MPLNEYAGRGFSPPERSVNVIQACANAGHGDTIAGLGLLSRDTRAAPSV